MTEARCPVHPDRNAARTCDRCGRFLCAECAGDGGHCRDCLRQLVAAMPSSRGRADLTVVFLFVGAGVDGVSALLSGWTLAAPDPNVIRDGLEGLLGLGILVAYVGSIVTFLRWQHLAVRQLTALGLFSGVTPGGAVGAWFIPFVNLTRPFQNVRAMLAGAGGEGAVAEARAGGWWAMWIISNVAAQIESRVSMSNGFDGRPPTASYGFGIFSSAAGIVAAVLCIGVVRTLQRHLDDRLKG